MTTSRSLPAAAAAAAAAEEDDARERREYPPGDEIVAPLYYTRASAQAYEISGMRPQPRYFLGLIPLLLDSTRIFTLSLTFSFRRGASVLATIIIIIILLPPQ